MSDHRDLKVFRVSNANALSLYKGTRGIKGSDNLSLRSQLIRSAFSIPTNLVEGNKAATAKKFRQHVQISIDSSHELDYHLETLRDLELLTSEKASLALKNNEEVRKMLSGLRSYLDLRVREEEDRKEKRQTERPDLG